MRSERVADYLASEDARLKPMRALVSRYPRIKRETSRHGREWFSAPEVNARVAEFRMQRTCGCCFDAPMMVWLFVREDVRENGVEIFSDPCAFRVADREDSGDYAETGGWRDEMIRAGIPNDMISRVARSVSVLCERKDREPSLTE